ncbi:UPS4 [Symbiodinium sp. CCMP2592]|nr:UPS4 [Symbiodinium sp. CCMP2592]
MDFDNESLLKCFCSEEEERDIIAWNKENEHARSDVFEFRLEEADKLREEGNQLFKTGDFATARQRYYGAIWHLDFDIGQQWNLMDHHQLDLNTRKLKVISNICGAYLKEKDWVNTKKAADIGLRHMEKAALTDNDSKGKFLYRKGFANLQRGFAEDAVEALKQADALIPGDRQLRSALKEASELQKTDRQKAKDVWKSKLLSQEEKACQGSWTEPALAATSGFPAELAGYLDMFAPESSDVALPMMLVMWFCFGIWPSLRKKGGSDTVNFGLTYVFAQVLITLCICFTFGMANPADAKHFDTEQFTQTLQKDISEKSFAVLTAMIAGVSLCSGDFIMAKAIDVLGLAVACPIGFGLALTYGTALTYAIEPKADAHLLFPGLGACLLGMLCNAASQAEPRRSAGAPEDDVHKSKAESSDKTSVAVEEVKIVASQPSQGRGGQGHGWYVFLLPIAGGLGCGSMSPITTAAATEGQLHPFSQLFSFMLGQLLAIFPLVSAFYWIALGSEGRRGRSPGQIPCAIWKGYFKQYRKALMWDALAGICVGLGYFMFMTGTPVVSKAVGWIFGSSSLLLSVVMGVLVFKELKGKSTRQQMLCAFCVIFLVTALALMCAASI